MFVGKKHKDRSEKPLKKCVTVNVDNDDQDTKDQKKYLGPELYEILVEVKNKIELGELDEKEEEDTLEKITRQREEAKIMLQKGQEEERLR